MTNSISDTEQRIQYLREINSSVGSYDSVREGMIELVCELICMSYPEDPVCRGFFKVYMKDEFDRFFEERVVTPLLRCQSEDCKLTTDELRRVSSAVNEACVRKFFKQGLKIPENILNDYDRNPEKLLEDVMGNSKFLNLSDDEEVEFEKVAIAMLEEGASREEAVKYLKVHNQSDDEIEVILSRFEG